MSRIDKSAILLARDINAKIAGITQRTDVSFSAQLGKIITAEITAFKALKLASPDVVHWREINSDKGHVDIVFTLSPNEINIVVFNPGSKKGIELAYHEPLLRGLGLISMPDIAPALSRELVTTSLQDCDTQTLVAAHDSEAEKRTLGTHHVVIRQGATGSDLSLLLTDYSKPKEEQQTEILVEIHNGKPFITVSTAPGLEEDLVIEVQDEGDDQTVKVTPFDSLSKTLHFRSAQAVIAENDLDEKQAMTP